MKTAITVSMAMALFVATIGPVSAQVVAPGPVVGRSSSAGPWIVGGIGLGALSVIARAKVVSDREKRELTSTEATQAIFLPFLWVFSRSILGGFNLSPPIDETGTRVDFFSDRDLTGKKLKPCGPPLRC
jgi:hypothetical protein